jgi:hypothetical protein
MFFEKNQAFASSKRAYRVKTESHKKWTPQELIHLVGTRAHQEHQIGFKKAAQR